jgi:ABC-type phosphate transport system substrate-binding protein
MDAAALGAQKVKKRALTALAMIVALLASLSLASQAAAYGQVESWGSYGFAAGQFANPVMLGANSSDGTVFAGDLTKIAAGSGDSEFLRIQKLSASGSVLGSAELRRFADPTKDEKPIAYYGIAVDPSLGRFYVLEARKVNEEKTGEFMAKQILVFSTTPKEGKLVAPEGGPSTLPVPSEAIFKPRQISVDPSNHDLVLMGENKASPKRTRLQRISSSGVAGTLFIDSGNVLRPNFENPALSFAVGPTGITYAVVGLAGSAGKGHTRAYELNPAFTTIQAVPGFAEAIDSEEPAFGFEEYAPTAFAEGPQMAIDGDTLYWKERIAQGTTGATGGNILVHGFSLSEKATTVVYGGGEAAKCRIESSGSGLAVSNAGKLVVFDYGPIEEEKDVTPGFGDKVLTFGPTGSNCTAPVAKFKANGSEGTIKVKANETVSFDASGSELASGPGKATAGFRRELIWDFGDGVKEVIKGEGGGEAPLTTTHKYTSAGNFTAKLTIRLKNPTYGNPSTVEHGVEVEAGGTTEFLLKVTKAGTGSGTVVSSPAGVNCGATCEAKFPASTVVTLNGTADAGSQAVVWSGCDAIVGSNECQVTMSAAKNVTATFTLTPGEIEVVKEGSGTGTVTSSPAGINCGSTCKASFAGATAVKLTGAPDAGSKAVVWTGCDSVNGSNECQVAATGKKQVHAKFDLESHLLKVTKAGTGSGTVVSNPSGINCGSTCEASFEHGKAVTLTGTPDAGSKAVVWTGCDSVNGSNECQVTMSAAKNVTATFDLTPSFTLKVKKQGTGSGTVTSSPAGINCGGTCEASFPEGKVVNLSGAPSAGSQAVVWTTCPGTVNGANECEVTMSAAKEVTATFDAIPAFALKVKKQGTGSGTVTSSPAGINCGGTCEALYLEGTVVSLSGTPDAGSIAVVWTTCPGTVNGSNECVVTMSAAKEAVATFTLEQHLLKVTKAGTGFGTVTSSPAGINCGSGAGCEALYDHGTVVKLSGSPAAGSKAATWSGCDSIVGSNECQVTMSAAKSVTATFEAIPSFTLKVKKQGTGSGTVTSSPAGINCGGTCEASFFEGTIVTLSGSPAAGSKPVVWTTCPGTVNGSNECVVTMSAAKEAVASFDLVPPAEHLLKVVKNGTGSGTVTSSPAGINCGGTCEALFTDGTVVKLTGSPAAGSKAVVWSGCDSIVGSNECQVTMSAAKEVTATFNAIPSFTLKVKKQGTGSGTVTSSPAGINCGGTCEASFLEGTVVTLSGSPAAGSKPVVWTTCPGTVNGSNECVVTMSAAKEAVAAFDLQPPAEHTLKVTKNGTGSGTVTSNPAGINCGSGAGCEASFVDGTLVTLTGTPSAGSQAATWGGCDTVNGSNQCEVTVNGTEAVTATFSLETSPTKCNGADIVGEGSSLQQAAQANVWIPGFQGPGGYCAGQGTEPKVTYDGTGSSAGLNAWDFNGSDGTPFDTSRAFVTSDDPPNAAQLANAKAASGSKVLVIPVAQTAIAVVVNPPANCSLEEVTNKQLESVFRGNVKFWGKLDTASGAGCAGAPITRVVRPDGSGTTYQFKNYLARINPASLACTEAPGKTWQDLEPIGANGKPNTVWPANGVGGCGAGVLSPVVTAAANGGAALVGKVNSTDGSIGYAALPDVEASKSGDTAAVAVQNNGVVKLAKATFALPSTDSDGANCSAAKYAVPVDGRTGASGEEVDWSQVFGANYKIGGEDYSLCTLTFAMALHTYGSKAGFSEGQVQTVRDYLGGYVTAAAGQNAIGASAFYGRLPSAATPANDVLGAAQLSASKIGF